MMRRKPKIQNCKYVLKHKPTGMYVGRQSGKYNPNRHSVEEFLTPHINDCRVFTTKATAGNAYIFQQHKDDFERLPVTLVILNQ